MSEEIKQHNPVGVASATSERPSMSLSDFIASKETVADETPDFKNEDGTDASFEEKEEVEETVEATEEKETTVTEDTEQLFEVSGGKVPLKDLLNAYATRDQINKEFSRLDSAKKLTAREKEEMEFVQEKFKEMHEHVLNGNPLMALEIALAMANPNKSEADEDSLKKLVEQAVNIGENYNNMSDEEKDVFLKSQKLTLKEKRLKQTEEKQAKKDAEAKLKSFYDNQLAAHKVTDAEIIEAVEDIKKHEQFQKDLEAKPDEEKINFCVSWVLGKRLEKTIKTGMAAVDKEFAEDKNLYIALLDIVDPNCTVESVTELVREYKASLSDNSAKVESVASKKDVDPKSATPHRAPTETKKAEVKKPILDWDEMVAKHSS